jgi:hypothetical protein
MASLVAPDSVPLAPLRASAPAPASAVGLKLLCILFILYLLVTSDVFTNNVVAGFGEKAVRCRTPTSWGTVLQGVFLVVFYVLAAYLIERRYL